MRWNNMLVAGLVLFALQGTAAGLPAGWGEVDVGGSGTGTTTVSDGTYTISGAGSDIWTPHDRFHYTYTQISGDASMTVRVASLENTNAWAKAGIMFRQNVNADDGSNGGNCAFVMACGTPSNGAGMEWRDTAGEDAQTGWGGSAGSNVPTWLRLVRTGNTFTAYYSSNGTAWTPLPGSPHTTVLSNPCYVGFAVCSHVEHVLATATFDHVTLPDGSTTGGGGDDPVPPPATGNWWDQWTAVDYDYHFGLGDFNGRSDVYETHPASETTPCRWLRTITATSSSSLHFEVSARADDYATTDWVLAVVANGQQLLEQVIHGTGWQSFDVDLSQFAGQSVDLELHNRANGWHWEVAYWDNVQLSNTGGGGTTPSNHAPSVSITSPSSGATPVAGASTTFSCSASDSDGDSLIYVWTSDLDGQIGTSSEFSVSNLTMGDHRITVQVSDGSLNASAAVSISVWSGNYPPVVTITSPVNGERFAVGESIQFECGASDQDGDSLTYSWASAGEGTIGTSAAFGTSGLSEGNHLISVNVSDGHGNLVSAFITVILIADADRDGMSDDWEELYGSDSVSLEPGDDLDGDGYANLAEFLSGTDPTNSESYPGAGSGSDGVSCAATSASATGAAGMCLALLALIVVGAFRRIGG